MKKNKTMGRPPAKWMYDLSEGQFINDDDFLGFREIADIFKISIATVKSFLIKIEAKGELVIEGQYAVKKFKGSDLKKASKRYVTHYQ